MQGEAEEGFITKKEEIYREEDRYAVNQRE
jgi:hypothetical protein